MHTHHMTSHSKDHASTGRPHLLVHPDRMDWFLCQQLKGNTHGHKKQSGETLGSLVHMCTTPCSKQ